MRNIEERKVNMKINHLMNARVLLNKVISEFNKSIDLDEFDDKLDLKVIKLLEESIKEVYIKLVNTENSIKNKYSNENIYSKEELQKAYDEGYIIQRKDITKYTGWGTLRKRPSFENDEYTKYIYRIREKEDDKKLKVYTNVSYNNIKEGIQ